MDLNAALEKKLAAIAVEHRRRWRQWVEDMADNKSLPQPLDVIETAGALGIDNAAAALANDVQALQELRSVERAIVSCRTDRAEKLKPWSGSIAKLRAAENAKRAEWQALHDLADSIDGNSSESFWSTERDRIIRKHPRILGSKE